MGKSKSPAAPIDTTKVTCATAETPHLGITLSLEVLAGGLPTEEQKRRNARSSQHRVKTQSKEVDINEAALKLSQVLLDDRATDLLTDRGGLGVAKARSSRKVIQHATDHPDEQLPLGELFKPEGAFSMTITEVLGSCEFGSRIDLPTSGQEHQGIYDLVLIVGNGFDPNDEFAPAGGE